MTPEWFENVCYSALGHRTSQEQTYDIARLVLQRGIPGDFVECGVYAGASCALMARAIIDDATKGVEGANWYSERRVHLFDSFAGIPRPGPHDGDLKGNVGGESAVPIEGVRANMEHWGIPSELLIYWRGEFNITAPWSTNEGAPNCIKQIALLRLDGDLYDSTRVCMDHLYPLVSPGGYVIVDDFNLDGARKAIIEHGFPAPVLWRKPQ